MTTSPKLVDPAPAVWLFERNRMKQSVLGFAWQVSAKHQIALVALSIVVFVLSTVPLELQRRIVNDVVYTGTVRIALILAATYAALALLEGALKMVMNIYRGWVSESVVRDLRRDILAIAEAPPTDISLAEAEGVELSLVLSESEPVGGFIGISLSEPLLQGGTLVATFAYMAYLEPLMAVVALALFAAQLAIVPVIQRAINRRAAARIVTMRDVSVGIVAGAPETGPAQHERLDRVFALNMSIFKLKFSMNFAMNFLHHLAVAAILAVGGWLALNGRIEVGTVVAFLSGLAKVVDPWGDVVNWYREWTVADVKYKLIHDAMRWIEHTDAATPQARDISPAA